MPAVQLDKLKLQSANLAGKLGQPDIFRFQFLEILDAYSNRTFRPGASTISSQLVLSYHLPERVMWQIKKDLEPQIAAYPPDQVLTLANFLWSGESQEEKTLAVYILGKISVYPPEPVMETFLSWFASDMDHNTRGRLVTDGLQNLRVHQFELWLALVHAWMNAEETWKMAQAYEALGKLLKEQGSAHLPSVLQLVHQTVTLIPASAHPEVLMLFNAMISTSRIETTYLVRQLIAEVKPAQVTYKRLLRKIIELMPVDIQMELKKDYLANTREIEK